VPGVSFSPDKMLQARLFSYGEAQRYRLGVNHHAIPVNAPRCPFHSYHLDGHMRVDGNLGATTSYFPNSTSVWADHPELQEPPLEIGGLGDHWDHRVDEDHFEQPGDLFRLMTVAEQARLFANTARAIGGANLNVRCVTSLTALGPIQPTELAWRTRLA
jgi:catalase